MTIGLGRRARSCGSGKNGAGLESAKPRLAIADISTADAFEQTLLAAKSIAYVDPARGATVGIHFAGVLARLGIADAVKAKTVLVPGSHAAEKVATYSAGRPARAAPPELGRAFIAFLARPAFKTNLAAMGLDCRE